jgi:DNA-binding IclR family transcriptional regulator
MLLQTIGDTPANRIVDFFIEGRKMDYSKGDVAEACGISRPTAYKMIALLEKQGMVRKTRTIGRAQLFTLNAANPRAQALLKLEALLLKQSFEGAEAKPKIHARASV